MIQRVVVEGIAATSMLEAKLRLDDYATTRFDVWATSILAVNRSVKAIQLAPNAIIKMTYPLKGHEEVIGYNLLEDPKIRKGVLKSIEDKTVTFIGPLKLKQNGRMALLVRRPVFDLSSAGGNFWGFATAIIYVEEIAKHLSQGIENAGLNYSLYGDDPDSPDSALILQSDTPPNREQGKNFSIAVPNGEWHLTLAHSDGGNRLGTWAHLSLLLLSLCVGYVIYRFQRQAHSQAQALVRLNEQLRQLASFDSLTGILNRRQGTHIAEELFHLAKRNGMPYSIAFLDVDHFKQVNDRYGHDAGDFVLIDFTKRISKLIREGDVFVRWGGEEFVLLLPETDLAGAEHLCEKVRVCVQDAGVCYKQQEIKLTVSIGVSTLADRDAQVDDTLRRADDAVYLAKRNGRNRCETNC